MLSGSGVECGIPGTAAGRVPVALLETELDRPADPELVVGRELLVATELDDGVLLAAAMDGADAPVSDAVPPTELQAATATAIAARPAARTLGRMWDIVPFCQPARSSARGITLPYLGLLYWPTCADAPGRYFVGPGTTCFRFLLLDTDETTRWRKREIMIRLAIGFVAGYVLGSAAGRKRYEQIASLSSKVVQSKAVQGAVDAARGKVYDLLPGRKPQAPDPAVLAAGTKQNPVVIT